LSTAISPAEMPTPSRTRPQRQSGESRRQREDGEAQSRQRHQRGLDAPRAERVERDAQRQLRHGIGGEHAGGQGPQLDRRQAKLHGQHRPDDRHHRACGLVHEVRPGERECHSQQHRQTV
jgi:hypothetical protein